MQKTYKLTLLITMAVVTWKVWKIETYLRPETVKVDFSKEFTRPPVQIKTK